MLYTLKQTIKFKDNIYELGSKVEFSIEEYKEIKEYLEEDKNIIKSIDIKDNNIEDTIKKGVPKSNTVK